LRRLLTDRLQRLLPGAELSELSFRNADDIADTLELHASVLCPRAARFVGDQAFVRLPVLLWRQRLRFHEEQRTKDILFPYPLVRTTELRATFPTGWVVEAVLPDTTFAVPGLVYQRVHDMQPDGLLCREVREIRERRFPAERYSGVREWAALARECEGRHVTLKIGP
jgi:hypothetical protein